MMTKIIAAAKRSGVLISGKKVDEWLKGKDEMTKPDLMLFKEMLTDKAQEKSDANNQVLTQIQQGFQGYVNATKGQTNIHTLASDIAGRIIDAIR